MRELRILALSATVLLGVVLLYGFIDGRLHAASAALLLLLVAQYVSLTADILLRMRQVHQRFALFMATRNLPSLLLITAFGLRSAPAVAVAEFISALFVGWFVYRSRLLRDPRPPASYRGWPRVHREQLTLWLARLVQYVNASLLRLIVPFTFGVHDTGLFFFACIAQIPCSLFLSVTTQLFGHALARMKQGEYRAIARIQAWFLAPNALYVIALLLLVPYWPNLIEHVPKLTQYAGIGSLILAVSLYSGVLSSDCTEYLLRSRGLSRILLFYNLTSIVGQVGCLAIGSVKHLSIERTIVLCAAAASSVLAAFSALSFYLVLVRSKAVVSTHVSAP